ncbi:MAG: hypothetical protein ACMXX6_00390 [Candidatus Woesearchaeota archaeon]
MNREIDVLMPLNLLSGNTEIYVENSVKSLNELDFWNKRIIIPAKVPKDNRSEIHKITRELKGDISIIADTHIKPTGYETWLREYIENNHITSKYTLMMQGDVILHKDTLSILKNTLEVTEKSVAVPMLNRAHGSKIQTVKLDYNSGIEETLSRYVEDSADKPILLSNWFDRSVALFRTEDLKNVDWGFMDFYQGRHWIFDELAIKLGGAAIDQRVLAYNGVRDKPNGEYSGKLSEIGIGWGPDISKNFALNSSQVMQGTVEFIKSNGIYQTTKMAIEKKLGITRKL